MRYTDSGRGYADLNEVERRIREFQATRRGDTTRRDAMMQFPDAWGDTFISDIIAGEHYMIRCVSADDDTEDEGYVYAMLDRDMARALATDLLAFADSVETEEET